MVYKTCYIIASSIQLSYLIAIISSRRYAKSDPLSTGLKIGISPRPYVYTFGLFPERDAPCGGLRSEAQ